MRNSAWRGPALGALAGLLALVPAVPAAAQMGGGMGGGGMGGGGMSMGGAPPEAAPDDSERAREIGSSDRGPQTRPLAQEAFDKAVREMFASADTNRDGMVTLDELRAVVAGQRDAIIRDRFREIDTNHDGRIDEGEFIAWQQALGAAAGSDCASSAGAAELVPESLGPRLGNSDKERALAVAIVPLSATVITAANVHYRAGITIDDLLAYEDAHFAAADTNHDGFLEGSELAALRPHGHRGPPRE